MMSIIVRITSIILTLGCLIFVLKGVSRPLSMACFAVAMLPFQISCLFFPAVKVNELAIIGWLFVFVFHIIRKKEIFHSRYTDAIFVFSILVSAFNIFKYYQSGNPGVLLELLRLIVAVVFPVTVALTFFADFQECFGHLIKAWNLAAVIVCILSIASILFGGYSIISYFMTFIRRADGIFYVMKFAASPFIADPNSYGGYLAISIGIAYYLFKRSGNKQYFVAMILEMIGLMTTLSRGAILSLIITFCVVLFINRKTKVIGALSVFFGTVGGISILVPFFMNDTSAMSRFDMWKTAFSMFKDYPVFGVGLNNYTYLFSKYGSAGVLGYNPYTHNLYLKILVESGIVGECLFLVPCFTLLQLCVKYAQMDTTVMMIFFGVLSFLIQGMTVEFFTSNYFWFLLIMGLLYMEKLMKMEKGNMRRSRFKKVLLR